MPGPMKRGANAALTREIPNLTGVVLGVKLTTTEPVLSDNLVIATVLCNGSSKALSDEHFVFFNQLTSPETSVSQLEHARGGDTEQVEIDLDRIPAEVERIAVVAYINDAAAVRRSFGQVREAVIRVLDLRNDAELVRSENLAPELSQETGLVLGELYRHGGGWKFKVVGQGYATGIAGLAADFGVGL